MVVRQMVKLLVRAVCMIVAFPMQTIRKKKDRIQQSAAFE